MELLQRNLDTLRQRDPELAERIASCRPGPDLEVLTGRTGAPTFRVQGRLEASAEDPEREGRELAAHFRNRCEENGATRLVLFGLGVHTLRFLADLPARLLVVEPSLELCRGVLERLDLSAALEHVELIIDRDPAPALRHALFRGPERGLLLAHATARRRAPKLHDELAQRFQPGGVATPLDIAVIPPLYGGSLPVAKGCVRALKELGHYVRPIDFEPFWQSYQEIQRVTEDPRLAHASETLRAGLVRLIGETLLASFELDPPDLLLAVAQAPLDVETLARVGRMGITRAFWFCEDCHVMPYWRGLTKAYDTIFHVQPDALSAPLREAGGYGIPLPMAFDPSLTHPTELTQEQRDRYGCPLSFLGAAYHNRLQFLPGLLDLGLRIYGTGWPEVPPYLAAMPAPNVRWSTQDSNLIFNATTINLNLHSSPWCEGVNPVGDYLNPRTFELAGAGAFQLVDERSELAAAFEPGQEIETFRDLDECRRKILHYLDHEDERQEIAEAGRRRALRDHSYRQRMQDAIDALRVGSAPLAPRRSTLPTAGSVMDALDEQDELRQVLARVDPDQLLDPHGISLAVYRGDGDLSRQEKILLYMREVLNEIRYLNQLEMTR